MKPYSNFSEAALLIKIKFNHSQPSWVNPKIKRCLKERTELTKFYYNNGQRKEDQEDFRSKSCI